VKKPRYYCERCGAEVRKDTRICPHCGRFFSSVKCPHCGYVGEADDFATGCPVCGYADTANAAPDPIKALPPTAPPPPWWTYPVAAIAVLALALLLVRALR
jgi:RNA polymerase subunit RPABC4/transcription elongation factor Spt4